MLNGPEYDFSICLKKKNPFFYPVFLFCHTALTYSALSILVHQPSLDFRIYISTRLLPCCTHQFNSFVA